MLVAALVPLACAGGSRAGDVPVFSSVAEASGGMVVTGSPYATEAGLRVLEKGGNAVDASVAAAFALAVAEPTQSGLGGRTQVLLRTTSVFVVATAGGTEVPAGHEGDRAPTGETGYAAVGIPGTVAALVKVHAEHGALPLADVMAPSIGWAEGGVLFPEGERRRLEDLIEEEGPESPVAALFAPGPDGRLVQPALGRTLRAIAAGGHDGFYRGSVAQTMVDDIRRGGGFVTAEDLTAYQAREGRVGATSVAGHHVVGSYLPASGITVAQILGILDRTDLPADEGAWTKVVAEALVAGFEDRELAEAMPPDVAVAWLTSDSLLARRAREVEEATRRGRGPGVEAATTERTEPPFTSHLSVADAQGNVVALTQSLGPSGGARVATPTLGFLYASTLGGYLTAGGPGYRPWSSQAPLLVMADDGPVLVAGGAGARRIISALVATLSRVLHRGAAIGEASTAPRFHPTGGRLYIEEGWGVIDALEGTAGEVVPRDRSYFARLNLIEIEGGRWRGVAEAGWSGASAAGPR